MFPTKKSRPIATRPQAGYWRSRRLALALIFVQLLALNVVTYLTLSRNLDQAAYPVDADSIGIPLLSGLILSTLVSVILVITVLLPSIPGWMALTRYGASLLLSFVVLIQALGWSDSLHWPVAMGYVGGAAVSAIVAHLIQPKQSEGSEIA